MVNLENSSLLTETAISEQAHAVVKMDRAPATISGEAKW
jgi:hypothetical protein